MSSIEEKLKDIIIKNYNTVKEFAAKINIPYTTMDSILKRGVEKANVLNIIKICDALNIEADALANGKIQSRYNRIEPNMSSAEIEHIYKYRKIDIYGKDVVDTVLDKEYLRTTQQKSDIIDEDKETTEVPYYIDMAAAGSGFDLTDNGYEMLKVVKNRNTERADFIVKVSGASMEPEYFDGDLVLVHSQPDIYEGEIGIFTINDMGYIKQKGPDRLISLNKKYKDIYVGEYDTFRCAGKVVAKLNHEDIVR